MARLLDKRAWPSPRPTPLTIWLAVHNRSGLTSWRADGIQPIPLYDIGFAPLLWLLAICTGYRPYRLHFNSSNLNRAHSVILFTWRRQFDPEQTLTCYYVTNLLFWEGGPADADAPRE